MTAPDTPANPPLRLRAGAYYRDATGRKVGPMRQWQNALSGVLGFDGIRYGDGNRSYWPNGRYGSPLIENHMGSNLIAEWVEPTPVQTRTTTRTVIVQGQYGIVQVAHTHDDKAAVFIAAGQNLYTARELRAAAATLTQLADGLDQIAQERTDQ